MTIHWRNKRKTKNVRKLHLENLEFRQTMNADFDDQISEARPVQLRSDFPVSVSGIVDASVDVDMFAFNASYGQTIDFDIDTPQNGPGGLGAYIRIFNSQGVQISANNDAAAPGEARIGFDSYLRHTFNSSGTYYVGVSTWTNTNYNAVTGLRDTVGQLYSTGAYQLTVQAMPVDTDDALFEATYIGQVSRNPRAANGQITWDVDADMFAFGVTSGQSIDIDLDTPTNGPGGLGSYLRIFNSSGQQLAANNDGAAPGESLGFDSFIRYRFSQGGTYFVGVSNWLNTNYNPITGNNDAPNWQHALGSYTLILNTTPVSSAPPINVWLASVRTEASRSAVEKLDLAEDNRWTPVPVSNAVPQDWSVPARADSNQFAVHASVDDFFASIGRSESDRFRRLSKPI